jgi:Zn-dependent M28 family amino/carboxypeptidase
MRKSFFATAAVLALLISVIGNPFAAASVAANSSALRHAVTLAGMQQHLQQLQEFGDASIADPDYGISTRVDESPGFELSVDYVAELLDDAGYNVTIQDFTFERFVENTPSVLQRVSPDPETFVNGEDFQAFEYSANGDVTAPIQAVDLVLPPGAEAGSSTSGCESTDFSGFVAGNIALLQRGTCDFVVKAANAEAAGAVGVIIFNEGQEGRTDIINGTLGETSAVTIPAIDTTFALGNELAQQLASGPVVMHIATDISLVETASKNVIANTPTGRRDRVVLVGAHLDSVEDGPGINDNGSGTAAILETALQMAELGVEPVNQVRFAFWGGEEFGLLGAEHYAAGLTKKQLHKIALNLNFDMIASPNFVRFVYDGDGSATGGSGPSGSANIEKVFNDYFRRKGLATAPTAFDGRSDYGPFIDRGIPAGGLFTGAEGIKTANQEEVYGGTAGEPYDSCYHQACDDIDNINNTVFRQMGDAVAHATYIFAMTTSDVSGTAKASEKAAEATLTFAGGHAKR